MTKVPDHMEIQQILASARRFDVTQNVKERLCAEARDRPEATYTEFIREFGERFVPGHKVPSVVECSMGGPLAE